MLLLYLDLGGFYLPFNDSIDFYYNRHRVVEPAL